jgi:hypothetical protein
MLAAGVASAAVLPELARKKAVDAERAKGPAAAPAPGVGVRPPMLRAPDAV